MQDQIAVYHDTVSGLEVPQLWEVTISLLITGTYLIHKATNWKPRIHDPNGILLPSLIFLISPFIIVKIISASNGSNVADILKSLAPVGTFMLGTLYGFIDKIQKEEELKRKYLELMIARTEGSIILPLHSILSNLLKDLKQTEMMMNLKASCKKARKNLKVYRLRVNFSVDQAENINNILILEFTNQIDDDLKALLGHLSSSPEDILKEISKIEDLIVTGYEYIMNLIKGASLKPDITNKFLMDLHKVLKSRQEELENRKKARQKSYERGCKKDCPTYAYYHSVHAPNFDGYADYETVVKYLPDPEDSAIQRIERLLELIY